MVADRTTLALFLIGQRSWHPSATGELNGLILDVALACRAISKQVSYGALAGVLGAEATVNVHDETQQKLDVIANELFLRTNERGGWWPGWSPRSSTTRTPSRLSTSAASTCWCSIP